MAIPKKIRQQVYEKYNGRCGYTGKPLDEKWQIDHITPLIWYKKRRMKKDPHDISNLIPCLRIINHYKRANRLEGWREYILTLHIRLKKFPKKTRVETMISRKRYVEEVAAHFDIAIDKPFDGMFYFEKMQKA